MEETVEIAKSPSTEDLIEDWMDYFELKGLIGEINDIASIPTRNSLYISYMDLFSLKESIARALREHPRLVLRAGELAIRKILGPEEAGRRINIRFTDLPSEFIVNIRDLRSVHLDTLVMVEGLVRKATDVKPRLRKGVFICQRCGHEIEIEMDYQYREPLECPEEEGGCGRKASSTKFELDMKKSTFVDVQKIEIQESPESLTGGDQPKRLSLYFYDDIAGKVFPGDQVKIWGILRARQKRDAYGKLPLFDIYLEVNNYDKREKSYLELEITEEDEIEIRKYAKRMDIYQLLINSLSPSIYGMEAEKLSLILQLFGGVEKNLPDGTRVRGDIHVLLVGDPGTAKSQLLRYIADLAPRGIYTSGKSSSAAGLTAAVVKDEFGEGNFTLEAGALVLADGGIACIDEIDKMSEVDRSVMHTAMEQQVVALSKAGIQATLRARCSILAAANPKFGRFGEREIVDQINIPPVLLSRFDIIFAIRDLPNPDLDRRKAVHILNHHQWGEKKRKIEMTTKGRGKVEDLEEIEEKEFIPPELLRKYVSYARQNIFPVLTEEAKDKIIDYFLTLRSRSHEEGGMKIIPITTRQLEAIIRLAEASARIRLSEEVTVEDADRAIKVFNRYLDSITEGGGIDAIYTGRSLARRERLQVILKIISELDSITGEGASIEAITDRAKEEGLTRDEVGDVIKQLLTSGYIYEPRHNVFKTL
ncbi:MAG: minichromosome maintenance protein MCM [Thermoplasmata archaeon]|nr:minichromosome maintenance protein MCM [Thermoplasmata archaeon]